MKKLFIKVDIDTLQGGIIRELGVDKFAILTAIASFANNKGEAFPSQDKIAEMVGYSRRTIVTKMKELEKVEINGEPIIRIEQTKTPKGRRNKYFISPNVGLTFGNVKNSDDNVKDCVKGIVKQSSQELERDFELEPSNKNQEKDIIVFDNAKHVLNYFRQKYFEKYNVAYQPNWGRDQAQIKNKLLANFTDSEIKAIIDVVCSEYETRWAKPSYPRPTIGQLCSWLGNEALAVASKQKDEAKRIEADSKKYEYDDSQWDRLLDEI